MCCACGGVSLAKAGSGEDVDSLLALLGELRELRTAAQREESQWQAEKSAAERVLRQRTGRLKQARRRTASLRVRLKEADASLKGIKDHLSGLEARRTAVRKWIGKGIAAIREKLSLLPLLAGGDIGERLRAAAAEGQPLGDVAGQFWNSMLAIAVRGVETEVGLREIALAGQKREVTVLRLGAVGAVFITKDNKLCGMAQVRGDELVWQQLPEEYLRAVRSAIRVARKEAPAQIVMPPLPEQEEQR